MPADTRPGQWEAWAARPALMPRCTSDDGAWRVVADGSTSFHGGWEFHWHHVEAGQWYEARIDCIADSVDALDQLTAEITWSDGEGRRVDWAHVPLSRRRGQRLQLAYTCQAPQGAVSASLRVGLRWARHGSTQWHDPQLQMVPAPPERRVNMAIATGQFPGTSIDDNLRFAAQLIDRAAQAGAQVVCLPETFSSYRLPASVPPEQQALRLEGPEMQQLCRQAKERGIDIAGSVYELHSGLVYNTGIYIDQERGLIGRYRKVHLSVGERWRGITPGGEFPVWDARWGKAGMLICFDSVMGEGHRLLAGRGAEVVLLPIMGDPRAIGPEAAQNWRAIMQVRAMDNHVWMVVCRNKGDWSMIVRPDGAVVAEMTGSEGICTAMVDLNFRFRSTIGADFANRTWAERRPSLYGDIAT